MAKRKSEDMFYCDLCDKGFDYHSKYERHLQSAKHKMFVESLHIQHEERLEESSSPNSPPSHSFVALADKVHKFDHLIYSPYRVRIIFFSVQISTTHTTLMWKSVCHTFLAHLILTQTLKQNVMTLIQKVTTLISVGGLLLSLMVS